MIYEKGQKYVFDVKGSRRTGNSNYFAIEVNGAEQYVKAYEFQKSHVPTVIQCISKGLNEHGRPVFMQDIASLISQLYQVGDVGDFRIKSQPGSRDFYEVTDENGFCFRLVGYGNRKYYTNQMVRCRITFINMVRVEMEPMPDEESVSIPFYDLQRVAGLDREGRVSMRLAMLLLKTKSFQKSRKQYNEGNPLWLITALKVIDSQLELFRHPGKLSGRYRLLEAYISICRNLVEDSNYLVSAAEAEIAEYQSLLSGMIERAEDLRYAAKLYEEGKDDEFISATLEKLYVSGYLYSPSRQMRVIRLLLAMYPHQTVLAYMRRLMEIMREQHANSRFLRVFSRDLSGMLEIYIEEVATKKESVIAGHPEMLETMIRALAVRLLLESTDDRNNIDYPIHQSMLYRYASLLVPDNEKMESLTYKAYEALFGSFSRIPDFTWKDVADVKGLSNKLAESIPALSSPSGEPLCFIGSGQRCVACGRMITLMPEITELEVHNVIPEGIFTSTKVRIMLSEKIQSIAKGDMKEWKLMWHEIYCAMFSESNNSNNCLNQCRMPNPGDDVMVRIVGPSEGNPYEYVCKIEEEKYWGSGTINPAKQIVSYNVRVSPDWYLDRISGRPYLLRATVERIDPNGHIRFSMRKGIAEFNVETLDCDVKNLVMISRVDEHQYLGITRGGVTMFIPREEQTPLLRLGDFIIADIESVHSDGNVHGRIVGRAYESFDRSEAFSNLVSDYADGMLYEGVIDDEPEIVQKEFVEMPKAYMRELIRVTHRKGMMQTSLPIIYSYMALARIFAKILGDEALERYYIRRMDILYILSKMNSGEIVDPEELQRFMDSDSDLNTIFPGLTDNLERLRIINCLDRADTEEYLWQTLCETKDLFTNNIARVVLAHNLLSDTNSAALRKQLRDKIFWLVSTQKNR